MPHFGMGVRFIDLAREQRRAIEALIAPGLSLAS